MSGRLRSGLKLPSGLVSRPTGVRMYCILFRGSIHPVLSAVSGQAVIQGTTASRSQSGSWKSER